MNESTRDRTERVEEWVERAVAFLETPLGAGLLALVIYMLAASYHSGMFAVSKNPYFNFQADAFLHGQLSLRLLPAELHDLVAFNGRYYLYWPPAPAMLLMPFVAVFGTGFSDVAFTLVIAALNVALVAGLLRLADRRALVDPRALVDRRALAPAGPGRRALLALFFAFGSVHFILAPQGRVWFTGQEVGLLFTLLAYIAALSGLPGRLAFGLTGAALAGAVLTRNPLLFAGIWPAYWLLKTHWSRGWKELARLCLVGLAPVIAALLFLGWYNLARFGNPLDFGLAYHIMATNFLPDYLRYGAFSLHYVPINLYYNYVFYPLPLRAETFMGGSMLLLSPLFLAAFWALRSPSRSPTDCKEVSRGRSPSLSRGAFDKARKQDSSAPPSMNSGGGKRMGGGKRNAAWNDDALVLLLTVLVTNIPMLLLMGTGWVTFGPRYTLDFIAPMLLLTAMGARRWPGLLVWLAALLSMAQYLIGVLIPLP